MSQPHKSNRQKAEELRVYPRYKVFLPVHLQSVEKLETPENHHTLNFKTVTQDVSLGGMLVDLREKTQRLPEDWQPAWFRDRHFWVHLKGISTMPEGIFAKTRAVRLVGDDQTHPEAVGLEFQDLVKSIEQRLKEFLDSLSSNSQL